MRKVLFALLLPAFLGAQTPPAVTREFRGLWVATVANIDWPSKPGLSTWEQQRELLAILDRAAALKLNAIVFQVRPGADAFYASSFEPWSQFLTGRQGRAHEPAWDPLAFAVEAAHKRGLELHAWFNPYRAAYVTDTAIARNHISRTNPEMIWKYDRYLWMNPGDSTVRTRSVRAIVDVAKRYDVDGVHIDDYFYPYPVNDVAGKKIDFPDSATYAAYLKRGGKLSKDDWRRDNVDRLVEAIYKGVHAAKPWVKVGISPFGIWRPGNPPQIQGFDAYNEIYADSKKWLEKGWLDYLAPQLYWPIRPPAQSFPVLLDWWLAQNPKGRHIWPGLGTYRINETGTRKIPAQEIVDQIDTLRARDHGPGHIHFNTTVIMKNADGIADKLSALYADPALVPASPWLGTRKPGHPAVSLAQHPQTDEPILRLAPARGEKVWLWSVRSLANGVWTSEVFPGSVSVHRLPARPERVLVNAVSRTGILSDSVVVRPHR